MKTMRIPARLLLAGLAAALLANSSASAARRTDEALSLVPAEAASVAVVNWGDLRSSPLASKLFADADRMTGEGDAARFMAEARLNPKEDVDLIVIAGFASGGRVEEKALVLFEGRFDPDRLAAAAAARGAAVKATSNGDYYMLDGKKGSNPGAVAFVNQRLAIAGTESAVAQALATREAGGTSFENGPGLGRHLHRIDRGSAVWALVDLARYPKLQKKSARVQAENEGRGEPLPALFGAMKSVSLFAFEATPRGDSLEISAAGVSSDEEMRGLLEDSLRGVLAMWRLAVQEKQPELVSVLRRFEIRDDGEAVSISGTLPGSLLRSMADHPKRHREEQREEKD